MGGELRDTKYPGDPSRHYSEIAAAELEAEREKKLREDMGYLALKPLEFVMYAWPWGKSGTFLEGHDGPEDWAVQFLLNLTDEIEDRGFDGTHAVDVIRMAVGSGHGVGKSATVAQIIHFIMSTRPMCKGVVTASTSPQLETKTVPELVKWNKLFIARHWFKITTGRGSMKMVHRQYPEQWRTDFLTCAKENADAFQGLHAAHSTPFLIFDESSGVPDEINDPAEGGLTDGEPMFFKYGNRTRNTGHFNECWGKFSHRWITQVVDSRECRITNKSQIQKWKDDYGEDSDFFRVRVLGLPPTAATTQFIPMDYVEMARTNPAQAGIREPLLMGVDVARHGGDFSVIRLRKGRDSRTHKPYREEYTANLELFADLVIEMALDLGVDRIFVDEGGPGSGVVDHIRARNYGHILTAVNFGGVSPQPRMYLNMRSYMWGMMRDWLKGGAIDPNDDTLRDQLIAQEYLTNKKYRNIQLVSKEDMDLSPDDADSLALTFASKVGPTDNAGHEGYRVIKQSQNSRGLKRRIEVPHV